LATLSGHTSLVFGAGLSADGRQVVSGSLDGTLRLWDARNRALAVGILVLEGREHRVPIVQGEGVVMLSLSSQSWRTTGPMNVSRIGSLRRKEKL